MCTASTSTAPVLNIQFLTELGPLPLIQVDSKYTVTGGSGVSIALQQQYTPSSNPNAASTLLLPCSGHGVCNNSTGKYTQLCTFV